MRQKERELDKLFHTIYCSKFSNKISNFNSKQFLNYNFNNMLILTILTVDIFDIRLTFL